MQIKICLILSLLLFAGLTQADPLGTGFTYQGELKYLGAPANGPFDFQFELFDADVVGNAVGDAVMLGGVNVVDGVFTVELDFTSMPFAGDQLWLEIGVKVANGKGGYTGLMPRQKITAVPYALHAEFVAMNAVGSAEVDSGEVQLRIDKSCTTGSSIRAIDADGSVICTFPSNTTGQGMTKSFSTTETLVTGDNSGSYSTCDGCGYAVGNWVAIPSLSTTRTITAGSFVLVSFAARIKTDDINRWAPETVFFRILRGGTEIARTGVFTADVLAGYSFIESNVAISLYDNGATSGSYTWTVQCHIVNNQAGLESYFIGERYLTVTEIRP